MTLISLIALVFQGGDGDSCSSLDNEEERNGEWYATVLVASFFTLRMAGLDGSGEERKKNTIFFILCDNWTSPSFLRTLLRRPLYNSTETTFHLI